MISYTMPLDMTPGVIPIAIKLSQYDSDFNLIFTLFSTKGTFTAPSGTTAAVRGTKRDGNGYSASASISGTTVTVTGHEQMTAIAGKNVFEIVLTYNGKKLASSNFILDVERAAMDKDSFASNSVIRELVDSLDRADDIIDAAYHVDYTVASLEELLPQMQQARDEAVSAASSAADDVRTELGDDIQVVTEARDYIENYIEGLIYGDEVRY